MNDARVVNACIVGYGLAGRVFHAPTIAATPGLGLHGIVQRQGGDDASRDWPEARILRSLEQALDDPHLDLVVVATPNSSHSALATVALEAGRHVVVDKPLATSVAEGEALVDLAARRGRVLSVFHNRRRDGDFLTVRDLVEAGQQHPHRHAAGRDRGAGAGRDPRHRGCGARAIEAVRSAAAFRRAMGDTNRCMSQRHRAFSTVVMGPQVAVGRERAKLM